jgi:excisionase family DNA binding protein
MFGSLLPKKFIGHRQHMKKINGMTGEILTVKEVAEYLKVNGRTVYRLVAAKKSPHSKLGMLGASKKTGVDQWILDQSSQGKELQDADH